MPFYQSGAIRYYQLELLNEVHHAFVTRHGGVSAEPWASLNVGGTVGDVPQRVKENKERLFRAIGRSQNSVFDVWQVHGDRIVIAECARREGEPHQKADAIITRQPGLTLFMRFADCVPILLYDPVEQVVGIVHAGWKGTVQFLALKAVNAMVSHFHSKPANILAGIGPSVGAHHYTIKEDVVTCVEQVFGNFAQFLLYKAVDAMDSTIEFDLWTANRFVLSRAGVENIEIAQICTTCQTNDWYSYRGEAGITGRFGVTIGLD